jgi:hypothetical protein
MDAESGMWNTGIIALEKSWTGRIGREMSTSLADKIRGRVPGILTYGITPPKLHTEAEKLEGIAQRQVDRIKSLHIDGLILYDVQDEGDRVDAERPFPYLQTLDPSLYSRQYLGELEVPTIIYRSVGKYSDDELTAWLADHEGQERCSVFVGASSATQTVKLSLADAYMLGSRYSSSLTMGGVMIPERHMLNGDEHLRVAAKMQNGCSFFVSQAIYNVEASKDFLSDYYYYCEENGIPMVPILFNIAPCGSLKTLEFMKWLGISLPRWLEQELLHSKDILDRSVTLTRRIIEELLDFGLEKGIPVGCSVESVSTRKVEIEASLQLTRDIKAIIDKKLAEAPFNKTEQAESDKGD